LPQKREKFDRGPFSIDKKSSLRGLEVITYRDVTRAQAKREIQKYLKGKNRVRADEISDVLRIDLSLVNEVLLELWGEGWVEPERKG
jgi:PHP family Zn ribbon phosphoesterase